MTDLQTLPAGWIRWVLFLLCLTVPFRSGATASVPPEPERLDCGDVVSGLAGEQGSFRYFQITVPPETRKLVVRMDGGTGDADLYLRQGATPTLQEFNVRPYVRGNTEEAGIRFPDAGEWHVMIHADRPYEDVELRVHCHRPPEQDADETRFPFDLDLALYYELSGAAHQEETWSTELRSQTLHQQGRTAFTAGDYARAIDAWTRWAELDPTNPDPVSLVGDVHLRQGRLDRALEHYRRSLAIQPGRIVLMLRLARLLDTDAERPDEARALLNRYSRLFPNHPDVALARAEWLVRRRRYEEAERWVRKTIAEDPDNLRARALLHGLLHTPEERLRNMKAMRSVAERPGMETVLGQAIVNHQLLIRPESWVLMDFVERMRFTAPSSEQRDFFARLLPREVPATEDFRIGRLSRNWISSRDEMWDEEGHVLLSADPSQTEAYLRLEGSDAMHNGYIEAVMDDTRGYFWLYARRGEGNMIRFGFDDNGLMYQQAWIQGQLRANQRKLWSKAPGGAVLRLEIRGDGAYALVDGNPAFSTPLPIPGDMGLGWWGVAPWAPEKGVAAATLLRVSGGPVPVRIAWPAPAETGNVASIMPHISTLSALAPDEYVQQPDGRIRRLESPGSTERSLLARYYRTRLMPVFRTRNLEHVDWDRLIERAERDRLSGFLIPVQKMPPPAWISDIESRLFETQTALILVLVEPDRRRALVREIHSGVGLFPGARRTRSIPVFSSPEQISEPLPPRTEGVLVEFGSNPGMP